MLRKLNMKKMDETLKEHKKGKEPTVHSLGISQSEQACITRSCFPESYTKYLQKEDWYIKMFSNLDK
jgi:hypothetical protein